MHVTKLISFVIILYIQYYKCYEDFNVLNATIQYAEKVETGESKQFFRVNLIENDQEIIVKSDLSGNIINK